MGDLMLVAPATSNTLSSMVHGRCNNLNGGLFIVNVSIYRPAMDLDMYAHPSTQKNLATLATYGNKVLPVGKGFWPVAWKEKRMLAPEEILSAVVDHFNPELKLKGKKVLITAGPTYEAIDPVRFIGNHSSGKMGYALAKIALAMGAEVHLISGPTAEKLSHPQLTVYPILSASELFGKVKSLYESVDIAIAAAALLILS